MSKPFWMSRMLWVNAIAIIAIVVQYVIGAEIIDAEAQAVILAAINLVLRLVTGKTLSLQK